MNKITDSELLGFSNLTNLEWQFSKFETTNDDGSKSYKTIKSLLLPENFIRVDEKNPEIYNYIYVGEKFKDSILTYEEKAKGLIEMQQAAGIAMKYLEYSSRDKQEGYFLNDWEVVYAADNYKVSSDS